MPSDLILESDALLITQHIDAMPEAEKARAADVLKRYRVQQETAGQALFPELAKRQNQDREKLWSAFDDPKVLDKENGVYAEADRLEPGLGDNLRASELQARFLSHRYGQPVQKVRDEVEHFATQYSQKTWGEAVTDPAQFFAKAKADVTKERDEHTLIFGGKDLSGMVDAAEAAAVAGDRKGLAKWMEANRGKPGYRPELEHRYMTAWSAASAKINEDLAPYRHLINRTVRALQGETGADPSQTAQWTHPERDLRELALNDPNGYDLVLRALQVAGKAAGKDDAKGFLQKAGENFGRTVGNAVTGTERTVQSVGAAVLDVVGADESADMIRAEVQVRRDLQDLAQGIIDPAQSTREGWRGVVENGLLGSAGSLPYMLAARNSIGQALMIGGFADDARADFRNNGWTGAGAESVALVVGAVNAAVESASEYLEKIPGVSNVLAKMGAKPGSKWLTRMTINALGRGPTELLEEYAQQVMPAAVQSLARELYGAVPARADGYSLAEESARWWSAENVATTAIAVLPLAIIGAGISTPGQIERAKVNALTRDVEGMSALIPRAEAEKVAAIENDEARLVEYQRVFGAVAQEVRVELLKQAATRRDSDAQAHEQINAIVRSQGYALRRDGEGWQLSTPDGATVKTASAQEAIGLMHQDFSEGELRNAQAVADMADVFLSQKRGGERIEVQPRQSRDIRDDVAEGRISPEQAREAIVTAGRLAGLSEEESMQQIGAVLGSSTVEENEGVREAVSRIYQGGDAMTVVEETIEGRWKKGLQDRRYTSQQGAIWVRMAEQATGESYLPESHTERELVEAISYIIRADVVGRRKDGGRLGTGVVSRGLKAAALNGNKEAGKFSAFLSAFRQLFKRIFSTARKLQKARAEGKISEDFDNLLDDLLGIDAQTRYEAETAKMASDWVDEAGLTYTPADGETFSLSARPVAKWSKADNLLHGYTNAFLESKDWQTLRDAIAAIDPTANAGGGGLTSQATGPETVSAELSRLYQASFVAEPLRRIDKIGGEHNVEFREDRVYKETFPETFGAKFDPNEPGQLVHASPLEYLKRWRAFSEIFPSVRFEGVVLHPNGSSSLQISQAKYNGLKPSKDELDAYLKDDGWKKVALGTWTKTTSRGTVRITDVKPDNFAIIDGLVVPLDVITTLEDNQGTSFSLAPRNLAALADTKMAAMMKKPELKEALFRVARERLAAVREDQRTGYPALVGYKDGKPVYERREAIREGMDKQAAATRTEASLKQEAKFMRQLRERELVDEGMGQLTSATIQTYERGVEALSDDPFIAAMLAKGKLMSRTTAEKAGKLKTDGTGVAGDYNGAPKLPPSFYGGTIMPTEMAQALADDGKLKDAYPDTLWDKLRTVIDSRRKDNEAFNKAREAVREVEKQAKEQAAKESEAWLNDARAKVPTEKERQMMSLRILDAILSAFPPEVRGRVGGFVKLASLGTDKAREAEIGRRLDKLEVELEKFAKKHFAAKLEKLLEKNRSERSKRGVFEGRTIATVTEQVTYAADFSDLSKEAQDKEIAHLETIIANPDSTREETSNAINKLGAAELFYDLKGKNSRNSEALEQAHDWLDSLVTMGRDTRKILDEERKAYLDDLRKAGVISILGNPNASQTDAENVMQKINGSTLRKALELVKGFINSVLPTTAQQLEDVFGQNSAVAEAFIPQIYGAANRSNDIKRQVEASRREMMGRVFKTSSTIKRIMELAKLQQGRKSGVFILDGRKTEDVVVPLEIMERLSDGTMTAKAAGLTEDEARMALDQWAETEGQKQSATIERVTNPGTNKELVMSEMEALNYLLHWNQDAVRERMERHGWTDESITQLQAFLSPETKAIGEWMSEQYRVAGRALVDPVYRRLYHAPLPFVKNFAPTFYDRAGNDSTLGLDAAQNSSGMMASFTKGRRAHSNNVRRMDAMTAFLSHFEHVSNWVSFVELLRDMKAVLGSTEVQNATIATYGPSAASAMSTRMKAIESQGNDSAWALHDLNGFFGRMNQARAFKGLAWRVSPIMKQTSAFLNPLLADVPANAYAVGLGKLLTGKLDVSAMWKSPIIQRRIEGGFSPEARMAMQASGDGPIAAVAIQLMQKGMMPMQYTDAGWTAAGAAIAFDYYRGLAVKAGEANPEASALRSVERMIATSAQPADLVNRSLVEASSNPFLKSVWMFASESRKTLAVEYYAAKRLATGKSKDKAMDAQRILTAHFIMGATTQLMSGLLASALGSDDDKEREWSAEEWATALIAGPVNGLFVLGDGLNTFIRLALGLKVFRGTSPFGQAIEEAGKSVANFDDLWSGDSDKAKAELDRLSSSAGTILSGFFGPAAQAPDVILGNPIRQISKALDED